MPDTVASIAPWLIPGQGEGDNLASILARSRQQGMEQQRIGMEQEQLQAQKAEAARNFLARQTATQALAQIALDDPKRDEKIRDIITRFAVATGKVSSGMIPPAPPQVTDLTDGAGVPNPKTQPSPAYTSQLQGILNDAGLNKNDLVSRSSDPHGTPINPISRPSDASGKSYPLIVPGTGKMITDGQGRVHIIPGRQLTPPRLPTPERPTVTKPGDVVLQGGKPIYTNTQPKSVSGPAPLPRPMSVTEFKALTPEQQTNYVQSVYKAQTERLGGGQGADSTPKSLPAGTKLTNSKGEVKYMPREGIPPEGWTAAQ